MLINGILNITLSLVCIGFSFWSLQAIKLDRILYQPKGAQAKLLHIILSVALGHAVATFLTDYYGWTSMLR